MSVAAERIWGQIRATRANPPAPALATAERRRTYGAALEQAQQMFRAAESVGPETQPLLIFYGLSQAGRAIAAASGSSIARGDGWRLQGHGIQSRNLDGPLPDIQIMSGGQGRASSFVRLSEILGSPLLPESAGVRMEDLWDYIPENQMQPLTENEARRRMPLLVNPNMVAEPHPLISVHVEGFPPSVVASSRPREALDRYLSQFPHARDRVGFKKTAFGEDAGPEFIHDPAGWGELLISWAMPSGKPSTVDERLAQLKTMVRISRGGWWFFPEVRGIGATIHPMMAWWAVLHALSMLARYEPDQWARHIDVDEQGSRAVAIEQLLREALTIVPQLVVEAIEQVAEPGT